MHRREFVKGTAAAAAMSMMPGVLAGAATSSAGSRERSSAPKPFKLRYAFDAGQFSNSAPGGVVEEIKFAHDQGFTAMEDNRMKSRPVPEQEAIAREMQRLGMTMGIILNNGGTGFKANGSLSTGKPEERDAFLSDLGLHETGLNRMIHAGYKLLGLITFFTAGPKEARAWTVHRGARAPQAAGEIHTDFERGFIRAETIAYDDFVKCGGEAGARDAGKLRSEGKDYVVQDGDVMLFRFNV